MIIGATSHRIRKSVAYSPALVEACLSTVTTTDRLQVIDLERMGVKCQFDT
jgi:hypothetical protein